MNPFCLSYRYFSLKLHYNSKWETNTIMTHKPTKENTISREVTALNEKTDAILIFDRHKDDFDYPMHYHPEYELNFLSDCKDSLRVVGDSIEPIDDYELCLVGPNLYHVWQLAKCQITPSSREITTQFVANLFPQELRDKDMMKPINDLLNRSKHGVLFSKETARDVEPLLSELAQSKGFEAYLIFLRIMAMLAVSPNQRTLASESFQMDNNVRTDARMEKIHNYMTQHYHEKVMLSDVADQLNMSPISVTRLIKQRTGKSFIDFLNEIRIGFATRMMVDSEKNISEICFCCGFNNVSNFNRIFKKRQGITPTEFRQTFHGTKRVS